MVRAGDYREKIRIEVRTSTQNAEGEPYNTWTTLATVRCAIQRQNGRETFEAHQREGRVSTIFRIRYSSQVSTISPAMRLVLLSNNAVYNIISAVDQGGRREEILIVAEEHVGETAGPDGGPYVPPVVTLDADKVNVSAISGLSADDAQGAFAEHQSDIEALQAADTTLQGNIDAEAASRGDADDLLDGRVTANEADIASLQTDLATEQTTRAAADSALDGRVTDAEAQLVAADENTQGFVSKVAQTFAGLKTFVAGIALQAKLAITGIASGENAIEVPTNARIQFGTSGSAHLYSNGTATLLTSAIINAPTFSVDKVAQRNSAAPLLLESKAVDSATAVAHNLDTANALSTAGAKLLSIRNAGTEKASVKPDGSIATSGGITASGAISAQSSIQTSGFCYAVGFVGVGNAACQFITTAGDAANAVGVIIRTNSVWSNAGARLLSVQNSYVGDVSRFSVYASGDVELHQAATGVILKSPDGTKRSKVTLANDGVTLVVTPL